MSRLFVGGDPNTTTVTDYIDFSVSPILSTSGHVVSTAINLNKIDTSVDSPNPISAGSYQDTGPTDIIITLTGIFLDAKNDNHQGRKNIRSFGLRSNTIENTFPHGVFGFVLDEFPEFNLTPSATRGGVILSIDITRPEDQQQKVGFIARIKVYGNIGSAPNFDWD